MLTRSRWLLLIFSFILVALCWWRVAEAAHGLTIRSFERDGLPLLYVAPQEGETLPGVLVAHGFAGSKQLMLGYAHVLARAGYAVMLWDFGGHGANQAPLAGDSLQQDLDTAYSALIEQPGVDSTRLALLGHSMGSGAVMNAAIRNPERFAATVAVSPTEAQVSPAVPRNLMLQAGSWEGRFVANAERLLVAAGGANEAIKSGGARRLVVVPNAKHITILFRDESHQTALTWLDQVFSRGGTHSYVDRRMVWYALHLAAWLLVLVALAPALRHFLVARQQIPTRGPWTWLGLIIGPGAALGLLLILSRFTEIETLGGLLVGGAVALWLFAAGTVWLLLAARPARPTPRDVGVGVLLFALLWVAVGALAQQVWLQWWLNGTRAMLWPWLSMAALPWFLASGTAQQDTSASGSVLWWLVQSIAMAGGLALTAVLVPGIGFVFLLLPIFPVVIAVLTVVMAQVRGAWAYSLAAAPFFGWLVAAAFPLAG